MQVFVISIKDSDRRAAFCQLAEKYQLEFQFFDAVNGAQLAQATIAAINADVVAQQTYPRKLASGEIGCSLSHRQIYQQMAGKNCWAVILEDDVLFDERLRQLTEATSALGQLDSHSLYHLGGSFYPYYSKRQIKRIWRKVHISEKVVFHKTICSAKYIYGTWGYLIHSALAENILAYTEKRFLLADEWYILTQNKIIKNIYLANIVDHALDTSHSLIEQERRLLQSQIRQTKPPLPVRFIRRLVKPLRHFRKLLKFI